MSAKRRSLDWVGEYDQIMVVVDGRYRGRLCWYDDDHGSRHAVVFFHPHGICNDEESATLIRYEYLVPLDIEWLKKADEHDRDMERKTRAACGVGQVLPVPPRGPTS